MNKQMNKKKSETKTSNITRATRFFARVLYQTQ